MKFLRRYVEDTICFVKMGSVEYTVSILNSFDANIQFTYEIEFSFTVFIDVLLTRNGNNIVTTVYHKAAANDLYLNRTN